jgi:hypothetical protein
MATGDTQDHAVGAWAYRMVLIALILAVLIALTVASVLAGYGRHAPEAVIAIGSAAVGTLASLLARPPAKNPSPDERADQRHIPEGTGSDPEWGSSQATLRDDPFVDDSTNSFLRGVGSVLEFFPPPERFNAWRVAQDIPLNRLS